MFGEGKASFQGQDLTRWARQPRPAGLRTQPHSSRWLSPRPRSRRLSRPEGRADTGLPPPAYGQSQRGCSAGAAKGEEKPFAAPPYSPASRNPVYLPAWFSRAAARANRGRRKAGFPLQARPPALPQETVSPRPALLIMPRVVALTPTGAVQGSSGETSSPGDENGSLCGRLGTEEFPGVCSTECSKSLGQITWSSCGSTRQGIQERNTSSDHKTKLKKYKTIRWHEIIGHIWATGSEKLSFKSKCEPFEDADTHSVTHRHSLSFGSLRMSCRKKVIDVAAGSTHCLALTEDSEVHNWRSNDQCQHFDTLRVTKPEPAALPGLDAKHIVGVTCGPAQSCAWSSCSEWSIGLRVPLRVDICSVTFEQLDLLLQQVSEGMDGSADWPPPQEKECMAVAMLNLPRLQLHAAISHQVDLEFLGLGLGSVLLNSLKQTVVTLASSTGMLSTVQSASQAMLQSGWSVLLPTAEKQAWALSALLPCAGY
nr:uncharacterized protein LOC129050013 [Pongo abelii]